MQYITLTLSIAFLALAISNLALWHRVIKPKKRTGEALELTQTVINKKAAKLGKALAASEN